MHLAYPGMQLRVIPVTAFRQNCSLVWSPDTGQAFLVDPGGDAETLARILEQAGLTLDTILLTHGHLDHAGGVAPLCRILAQTQGKAPRVLGPQKQDAFLLASITEQAKHFGLEGLENATVDAYTTDGQTLELLGCTLRVLHIPGHTPGHVAYVDEAARIAFVGDILFRGTIGRTDFAYGNGPQLVQGIREKLLPLGDDIVIMPGHGGSSTLGAERADNPFLRVG
ncbi:MAG: MBL fold metallo-hydrolase [Acetobacter orientalis]|uniref:MBL fold metallo-hydrolase n=1 Tax=Acetobacter orientalis TaxID=146474 RepID=UPI0039E8BD4D